MMIPKFVLKSYSNALIEDDLPNQQIRRVRLGSVVGTGLCLSALVICRAP